MHGYQYKYYNMDVTELVKDLFEKGTITKDEIIEFGKLCQLNILVDVLELDDEKDTYVNVKSTVNVLKQELIMDDNKLHISLYNYSLN